MSNLKILEETACIRLHIRQWAGRRQLKPEELGTDVADKLPPDELASPGHIKLCNPKRLHRFNRLRRKADRVCRPLCMRFMGGFATHEKHVPQIAQKLAVLRAEWEKEADSLEADLTNEIDKWAAEHPVWAGLIHNDLPDPAQVRRSLSFGFQLFRISATKDTQSAKADEVAQAGLAQVVNGMAGSLFLEIEEEAKKALKQSYRNKTEVGQKALSPIRKILTKLQSLRYLDARCEPVIDRITQVLDSLPKTGKVEGQSLFAVLELLNLLKDTQAMQVLGEAVLSEPQQPLSITLSSPTAQAPSGSGKTEPPAETTAESTPATKRNGQGSGEGFWLG